VPSLTDSTTTLALKGEYHLSRDVVLKASASRQEYVSNTPNSNYVNDVFLLGVRVQR
jgi:Putative beta-barrel porin 2